LELAADSLAAERADMLAEYRDVLTRGNADDAGRLRSLMAELGKKAVDTQADNDALRAHAAMQADLDALPAARDAVVQCEKDLAAAQASLQAAQARLDGVQAAAQAATRLVADLEMQASDLAAIELANHELFGKPAPAVPPTRLTLAQATPSAAALSAMMAAKNTDAIAAERAERAERIKHAAEQIGILPPDITPMQGCVEVP
jgi:hypothetical protein